MATAEQLLAALGEPILELDTEGAVTFASRTAGDWTGRETGYRFVDLFEAGDAGRLTQTLQRVASGKTKATEVEARLARAGEPLRPVAVKLAPILGEGGRIAGIGVWLRDIALAKEQEAAATVQGAHLLDLVDNVTDACVIENAAGTVDMANAAFCRLFAVADAPQSLIGTSCAALFEAAAAAIENRAGPVYGSLEAATARSEHRLALTGGDEKVVQLSLPVEGVAGSGPAGRMHLFHAEMKRGSEDRLQQLTIAAQMRQIETIAASLIATLEGAGSAIHRAEQLELPGQILEHFRRVERAAGQAFEAVSGLLDFSRIEGGALALESTEFHLREGVATMVNQIVPHAAQRNVQLKVRIEQDVPEHLIGDGARLMLVLRNLLDCAMPPVMTGTDAGRPIGPGAAGDVTLSVEPEYVTDNVIHLSFSVEHALTRGAVRPKTAAPASAMQLALARQVVRAFGDGKTALDVTERKSGTIYQFTVAFPFRNVKDPIVRPKYVTLTGLPILIVSNDIAERKELSELAKSWRMLAREADNATMALQLLNRMVQEENAIPLVITSNRLPVEDGFLLGFRIRHTPALKKTAVMMLATDGKPGDAIACRENGISAYLRQPLSAQQLNDAIAAVMGTRDDSEATATLITRHTLRESKPGSVLIVDRDRDAAMFAAGGLKKRNYTVRLVESATLAFEAMLEEPFDVIVVDPAGAGFEAGRNPVEALKANVGEGRPAPRILLASESPHMGNVPYDGLVLKPFAKDSLVNAIGDIVPAKT